MTPSSINNLIRQQMLQILNAALYAVAPHRLVFEALQSEQHAEIAVIAIGKAAAGMLNGAREALGERVKDLLVITAAAYAAGLPRDVDWVEGSHPLPDEKSLLAGEALISFLQRQPIRRKLIFLISGGASAMVEVLSPGITLEHLLRVNRWLLGSGFSIHQVNSVRKAMSRIKGGGLLSTVVERNTLCLLISDVPGDDPGSIGSGLLVADDSLTRQQLNGLQLPGWIQEMLQYRADDGVEQCHPELKIIACNSIALQGAASEASRLGFTVHHHHQILQGDAVDTAHLLTNYLRSAPAGIHLWGGETTVKLPEHPGKGGRNQQLALAAAIRLQGGNDLLLLSAGTDGVDGDSEDAGALIDGDTVRRGEVQGLDAESHLQSANANAFLGHSGDLIHTGPTGTNVMDIVIACKSININ
jgi:hydroxypyruvate reductase